MVKYVFDKIFSVIGLIILLPVFILISLSIFLTSKGAVFYKQKRVGLNGKEFYLYKFRTMQKGSDKTGLLTIGEDDKRITKTGRFLRKYKMDELPQLYNILKGDMSFVGPRPEVKKYVDLYSDAQRKVLSIKPGLTDYASIKFIDENSILGQENDPERAYIERIMPEKTELNLKYIEKMSLREDLKILVKTISRL